MSRLQDPPPEFYALLNSIRTSNCSKIERGSAEMLLRWRELVLQEDIIPIRPVNNKVRGHPLPCIFFVRPQEDNKSPASRRKRKSKSPSSRESNEEDDGWDIVHKEPGASGSALNDRGEQPAGRFNEFEGVLKLCASGTGHPNIKVWTFMRAALPGHPDWDKLVSHRGSTPSDSSRMQDFRFLEPKWKLTCAFDADAENLALLKQNTVEDAASGEVVNQLREEVRQLREQNTVLLERVRQLENQLGGASTSTAGEPGEHGVYYSR